MTPAQEPLYRPQSAFDVLAIPLLGKILKHRWGRLALQIPLFIAAIAVMLDGFTGPQLASRNLATVAPWVHYRGLVVIALLLAGNLFCMGCPFTVTRTLGKRLAIQGRRFPRILRNKWLAIAGLFVMFFLYEYLDLWGSPLLTAWVIAFYFVASFLLEAIFTESAFCKYVCPLGTFNFVYSTLSPTQIAVKNHDICAVCVGKECVNGSYAPQTTIRLDQIPVMDGTTKEVEVKHSPQGTLGCGTLLFAPQIRSNMDCTMCLDCVRACPHDNIGLMARKPTRELSLPDAWARRWDLSMLAIALTFMGIANAFGMVPPYYEFEVWLRDSFGFTSEFPILLISFGLLSIILPIVLSIGAAYVSRKLTRMTKRDSIRDTIAAFAPAFVPLGFGIWFAHYSFHFLIGPGLIVPVIQEFLGGLGQWSQFSGSVDLRIISMIQFVSLVGGFFVSMSIAQGAALRLYRRRSLLGLLPWSLILLVLMLVAWQIFSLPMEMRGTASLFG